MDFGALPPEINSARMYSGPGSGSMLAAAAAWDSLAADLHATLASSSSVVSGLTGHWSGPASTSMTAAVAPYTQWMSVTAAQAEQTAAQARAAAAAYEAAFAMTVPPPVIAANRSLLMSLVATNFLGQNTPAIAATEVHYAEMWAQDAAAMYGYAGSSATASQLPPFSAPPQVANPGAAAAAQAVGASGGAQTALSQLTTAMPQALQSLAAPLASSGSDATGTSSLTSLTGLSSMMMPLRMATMPLMMLSRLAMMGGLGAKTAGAAAPAAAAQAGAGLAPAAMGELAISAAPAAPVSAGLGQAVPVGALSVPQGWGTVASPAAASLVSSTTGLPNLAAPAAAAGSPAGMSAVPPMVPFGNVGGRAVGETTPELNVRPTVMVRSPLGG